jgi:hypothetical protein
MTTMAGIPTEHLADQIQETNRRLVQSNDRLADEIHALGDKLDTVERRLDEFRVEVARSFSLLTAGLEGFRARTELALKVAVWGVGLAVAVILAGGGALSGAIWYAAKLDSRVEHVESRLGNPPAGHAKGSQP